ncbi:hypothetical protein [Alkalihalobacillus trypoxylicola]|uniref:Uncharacterized protein n=1 Tax=Alkalihalobacillus trypoxylicola TaxID=519424 RepID=A0A162DF90_9BACI|nr:hypothetical protein [Alkalihalobacillus trypoxylicola]KYG29446.1 hypothetical protein AZF04_07950 [Alkalihalobacillus trypoxylicola]
MNTFKGPFQLFFEDFRMQMTIIAIITAFIFAVASVIGYVVAVQINHAIFGPVYGLLFIYPFIAFTKGYKNLMALGGTRKQFLLSVFINAFLFIAIAMILLNSLHFLNQYLYVRDLTYLNLIHTGSFLPNESILLYFWSDFIWAILAFSIGFIINALWHYFGAIKSLMIATIFGLGLLTWYMVGGNVASLLTYIVENPLLFIHILLAIALTFLVISYLLMKNGPLEKGGHTSTWGEGITE